MSKWKEVIETFLICASVVTIVIVLWTYHPREAPPAAPGTCTVQSDGASDDLAHMPPAMIGKDRR